MVLLQKGARNSLRYIIKILNSRGFFFCAWASRLALHGNALYVFPITMQNPTVIECLPNSLCSWDYTMRGLSTGHAAIAYDWLTEQGVIASGNMEYDIRKHGFFSGQWTLEQSEHVIADAQKPSALTRTYEVSSGDLHFTLRAQSPFHRAFEIMSGNQLLGRILPAHAFTRRAVIDCSPTVPEPIQLFSFWLVALSWRRSARRRSGSS